MSERITRQDVETRCANLNRRMDNYKSKYRYVVEARNGYTALDRTYRDPNATMSLSGSVPGRGYGWIIESTVTVGTKREVAEYLHAMMVALDDAATTR
jgi:hypothetical protein